MFCLFFVHNESRRRSLFVPKYLVKKMKVKSSDIIGVLSLLFVTTILGDEQHGEQHKQEEGQARKDPMKLVKDSQ